MGAWAYGGAVAKCLEDEEESVREAGNDDIYQHRFHDKCDEHIYCYHMGLLLHVVGLYLFICKHTRLATGACTQYLRRCSIYLFTAVAMATLREMALLTEIHALRHHDTCPEAP